MICSSGWDLKTENPNYQGDEHNMLEFVNNTSKVINREFFNHLVGVILPDTLTVPDSIASIMNNEDCAYYKVENFCVSDLINVDFIHSFIKTGELTALTCDRYLETDDVISVTPKGDLLLSLCKDSFQALSLEGKAYTRLKNRYSVCIPLHEDAFLTDKKQFQRVQWALKHHLKKFTILMNWRPPTKDISPTSIASYLLTIGYSSTKCTPKVSTRCDFDVVMPTLPFPHKDLEYGVPEITEWVGLYGLGGHNYAAGNAFLSSYELSIEAINQRQVTFVQWTGFFSYHTLASLCAELRDYVMTRKGVIPWVSLYVQGYSDAPVHEDDFHNHENNSYTIFLTPSLQYLIVTQDDGKV